MAKNLVIVESPAKAKTIEGFLGEGYIVRSSFGHVRDLPLHGLNVDIEDGFRPTYEIPKEKKEVIQELRKLSDKAEVIWLATDEDREGEAISWHLCEALGLEMSRVKRIVFHEITKPAITRAIASPRSIDMNLVNAQQARRVLDRLVGFKISPILWKKVKPALSAGRVQSVAVRLIVEREREIRAFHAEPYYRVRAAFLSSAGAPVGAELPERLAGKDEVMRLFEECRPAVFTVSTLETRPSKKSPPPPFTTSTLQQEAGRKLGFSVAQTMTVAQKLYESGKITYMRTDSVNLSETALDAAAIEIGRVYGPDYVNTRRYTTKSKGAQEAHEAIRPTYLNRPEVDGDAGARRLYDLIWKRTIASQMSDARLEKTTATIAISGSERVFMARGEVLKFDGFLKVYMESSDTEDEEDQEGVLPPLTVGQQLTPDHIRAVQRFPHHPPRYSEASLVKKLEELGIGRPSTYAPTISTIQKREYVVKESREGKERAYESVTLRGGEITEETLKETTGAEKAKLFPTDIGMVVNDFLMQHFSNIIDYNFTATVEKEFDEIAEGAKAWGKVIGTFYGPFSRDVEITAESSEKAKGERLLGKDPASGKDVVVRIGRYGPMVQIGQTGDEEKPRFAGLRKDQRMEDITLQDALDLFKLPRTVGLYEEKDVIAGTGRFGPYLRHESKYYSLTELDPLQVDIAQAIEVIEAKRKAERERVISTFEEGAGLSVLNGRWGPYIAQGKKNYKIPKGVDAKLLTYQDCLKIIREAPEKKTGKSIRRGKAR